MVADLEGSVDNLRGFTHIWPQCRSCVNQGRKGRNHERIIGGDQVRAAR